MPHDTPQRYLSPEVRSGMRRCYNCKNHLPDDRFATHVVGGKTYRNRRCSSCRVKRQAGSALTRMKRALYEEAKNTPCADCGKRYHPVCMDFDHLPENGKKHNLSGEWRTISLIALKEEIAKCDVVCANCHRLRTHVLREHKSGRPFTTEEADLAVSPSASTASTS